MTDSNLIPVADVTNEQEAKAWDEAHAAASSVVREHLANKKGFVFISLGATNTDVSVLADALGLQYAGVTVLNLIGQELMGDGANHLPEAVAASVHTMAGLNHMFKVLREQAKAPIQARTPAGDIGAVNGHEIPEPPAPPVH